MHTEPTLTSLKRMIFRSVLLFCLFPLMLKGQDIDDGSRFVFEKDWTPWKKAILYPDTVKKLWVNVGDPFVFSRLAEFKGLKGLIITEQPLAHLQWLDMFPDLEVLELTGNGLKSIDGVQQLGKLKELSCASNFIQDLSPLATMDSLKILRLYNNDVRDIRPIAHMKQIETLDLALNPISDLSPIADWYQLKSFSVYRCPELRDISVVYAWTDLLDLNISFLELDDFSLKSLRNHTKLIGLRVQGMVKNDAELNYLMGMKDLEQLTMGKNDSVTHIDSLYVLSNLRYLDIHSNNVKDISVVRFFPRMVKVVMYRNQVTDVSPLLSCPDMRAVFMHENPIKDYSPVYQMGYLQYLNLWKNHFNTEQRVQMKKALPTVEIGYM